MSEVLPEQKPDLKALGVAPVKWLRNNVKLFLDQNLGPDPASSLQHKGYLDVRTVWSIGYVGANDGKLLKILQKEDLILITFDKKFHKMAMKYGVMSFLFVHNSIEGNQYSPRTIAIFIEQFLLHNYKSIHEMILKNQLDD